MYFYIDESGQTGSNLFDESQPVLYYGVLSCKVNLDILAKPLLEQLRRKLNVDRLHATKLGSEGLTKIVPDLLYLIKKYQFTFDFFRIVKADYAVICFFDQVFDQTNNPAMSWAGYWSPLKYVLLIKLASLFDDETLKRAWAARIDSDDKRVVGELVDICNILLNRIDHLQDQRSRQLIGDALQWAINNPIEISYNTSNKLDALQLMPNLIGFQSVLLNIASRVVRHGRLASSITVDKQLQFNNAQETLASIYSNVNSNLSIIILDDSRSLIKKLRTLKNLPLLKFSGGDSSSGLELVDILLWIFRRVFEQKYLASEIFPVYRALINRCYTDEVSISAVEERWNKYFDNLRDFSDEELNLAKQILNADEERRLKAMNKRLK